MVVLNSSARHSRKQGPQKSWSYLVRKFNNPWNRFLHFCHSRDGQRSFLGFGERKRERARRLLPLRPSTSATTNTLVTHSLFTLHFVIVIALLAAAAAASLYLFTLDVLSLLIAVALLYVKLRHLITQGRLVFKTNKLWTFKLVI